jgi:hypothetical protein
LTQSVATRKVAPKAHASVDKLCGCDVTKRKGGIKLTIRPLTPDLWPALEDLFGKPGASNGCWCMYWRIGGAYRDRPPEKNKEALRRIVKRGSPSGLVAFEGDVAVGWCQLTPRNALPWLDRMWWSSASTICPSGRSPVSSCAEATVGKA